MELQDINDKFFFDQGYWHFEASDGDYEILAVNEDWRLLVETSIRAAKTNIVEDGREYLLISIVTPQLLVDTSKGELSRSNPNIARARKQRQEGTYWAKKTEEERQEYLEHRKAVYAKRKIQLYGSNADRRIGNNNKKRGRNTK